ncbi:MAG: colicin immunity domain-containing protein [Pseudomonadota bacterium]|nr:colicin immunity domain-containing protein [Pseudomonadota bacterium]
MSLMMGSLGGGQVIHKIDEYASLISDFINGDIDAVEFRDRYLDKFKNEEVSLPERSFDVLDRLFGDIDSFTEDEELLASIPDFYVDAKQLKKRAIKAVTELAKTA